MVKTRVAESDCCGAGRDYSRLPGQKPIVTDEVGPITKSEIENMMSVDVGRFLPHLLHQLRSSVTKSKEAEQWLIAYSHLNP